MRDIVDNRLRAIKGYKLGIAELLPCKPVNHKKVKFLKRQIPQTKAAMRW